MLPEDTGEEQVVDRGDEYVSPEEQAAQAAAAEAEADAEEREAEEALASADEEEEELEAGAEEEDDEPAARERDEKGRFIPKDRFDEAVGRERQEKERLAARLAELEKREADRSVAADMEQATEKIKQLIAQHTQQLSDGELEQASATMGEIIGIQQEMSDIRARSYADTSKAAAKSEVEYDTVVAKLELDYPEINPEDTEAFDREAVRRVQAYMTGLMQMDNMSPAAALQESVTTILGAKRAAEEEETRSAEELAREAEEQGLRRKEEAVKKNLKAQEQQPADIKDVGLDHDKEGGSLDAAAVMKMSWEEFIKLPEEKLSEMRGDNLG